MDLSLKTLQPDYEKAFKACKIRTPIEPTVKQIADHILELRSHYENVERATGIPWWFAGILHYREWNFREPDLFEKKVIEVLLAKNYHQASTRTLGAYLWGLDLWNGFRGGAGHESVWIWGGTSILDKATDQVGVAAILMQLQAQGSVDIAKPDAAIKLLILVDTVFKAQPKQAHELSAGDKITVKAGTQLELLKDDSAPENHVKVTLPDGVLMGQNNRSEWYVFNGHVAIEGTDPDNKPNDPPVEPETKISSPDRGRPITVPKLGTVYLGEPIIPNGHFSWAEATKNGTRIPVNANVVDGFIRIAKVLEEVRDYLGDRPMGINSWYRDPVSNKKAGGVSNSQHLAGDAVDFVVEGIPPKEVNRRLDSWWGSRGGLASATNFTHIDARGTRARWKYPH